MAELPGIERPGLQALPQIGDRMTFLYLEHCSVSREDGAVLVKDERGTVRVPAAAVSVIMFGPGTSVTHRAVELIGDAGVSAVWVGEHGVRYYAGGRPLTHKSRMLIKQAELVSNQRAHRRASKQWNVPWNGRVYDPNDFASGDPVNQALSAGHACLYGLAHAVISALGCSPGLGFVHVGHECSFVYDVADLYKAEITIPIAFEIAAAAPDDLPGAVRRRVRDAMSSGRLLERMVRDIRVLILGDAAAEAAEETNIIYLWDERGGTVPNGLCYAPREEPAV